MFALAIASFFADRSMASAAAHEKLSITVTANQWWWDVQYNSADPSKILRTANELHLPVGVPTRIILHSNDVIHSFWVPSLAGKQDLIPGRETDITHRPAQRSASTAASAPNFAALQHAHMALVVTSTAMPTSSNGGSASCSPRLRRRNPLAQGRLRLSSPAPVQHVPQRSPEPRRAARVGPDLTHLASRRTIAAGTLPMSEGNLYGWVADPQSIKPGTKMPTIGPRARRAARRRRLSRDAQMTEYALGAAIRPRDRREAPRRRAQEDRPRRAQAQGREARRAARARRGAGRRGFIGWLATVDHKEIGRRYIVTALVFLALGGVLALLMRLQLARPDNDLIGAARYNELFTMHGSTMMFLFAVPVMEGVAVYIIPLMLGTRSTAFPRLNAFSYYMYLFGGLLLWGAFALNIGPDIGWFAYTPLSGPQFSPGKRADIWAQMITFTEVSALAAAVVLVATILKTRAPGMTLARMPLFAWAMLVDRGDDHLRHAVGRARLEHADLGPAGRHPILQPAASMATRCCGSICSGSSATPKSTSSSCPRPASSA